MLSHEASASVKMKKAKGEEEEASNYITMLAYRTELKRINVVKASSALVPLFKYISFR